MRNLSVVGYVDLDESVPIHHCTRTKVSARTINVQAPVYYYCRSETTGALTALYLMSLPPIILISSHCFVPILCFIERHNMMAGSMARTIASVLKSTARGNRPSSKLLFFFNCGTMQCGGFHSGNIGALTYGLRTKIYNLTPTVQLQDGGRKTLVLSIN